MSLWPMNIISVVHFKKLYEKHIMKQTTRKKNFSIFHSKLMQGVTQRGYLSCQKSFAWNWQIAQSFNPCSSFNLSTSNQIALVLLIIARDVNICQHLPDIKKYQIFYETSWYEKSLLSSWKCFISNTFFKYFKMITKCSQALFQTASRSASPVNM